MKVKVKSPFGDMEGWKTKATTIAGTLTGLGMVVTALASDFINIELLFAGVGAILLAWGLTGHAHKTDKLKKAVTAYLNVGEDAKPKDSGKVDLKLIVLLFALVSVLALPGCATFEKIFPPPAEPVCDMPGAEKSVICREFRARDLEPEQYEDLLLDSVAVAAIVEPESLDSVRRFVLRIRMALASHPLLTLGGLFTWAQENEQQFKGIANIVSRRLPWMANVNEVLDPFDLWLIEKHLEHIEELL